MNRRDMLFGAFRAALVPVALQVKAKARERLDGKERNGKELIGRPAPPLGLEHWIHSQPLEMNRLKGKVVLLRWWTGGCPLCEATAPALRKLQRDYENRGLQVIGIYHPKPPGDWDIAKLQAAAEEKQFTFPIALDADWSALKRWWLDRERDYTSVSFLVDRTGVIRYVHPGGEFHEGTQGSYASHETCNRDFRDIEGEIQKLLGKS